MTSIKHAHNSKNAPNPPLGAIENKKAKPSAIYTQSYVDGLLGQIANQKVLLDERNADLLEANEAIGSLQDEIADLKKPRAIIQTEQPGPQIGLGIPASNQVDDILT